MRFALEPGAPAELHRLQRWIRALTWVVGVAVFVPLADFLGGVDLENLLTGQDFLPAVLLSLFFAGGISLIVAFTFGVVAEWTCRHRIARAHRTASTERRELTATALSGRQLASPDLRRGRGSGSASAPANGRPSSPSHPRPG